MTEAEMKMKDALARHTGMSASDVVRQLLRREYARIFGKKPATTRRRR
jgi:hypothetical protein